MSSPNSPPPPSLPQAVRCEAHFPSTNLFSSRVPLLRGGALTPLAPNGDGIFPSAHPRPAPPSGKRLFGQSGRANPLPAARVLHPHGFRVLKAQSAWERSLRSYFRLPPAPSPRLALERQRVAEGLCAADAEADAEDARFFGPSRPFSGGEGEKMALDGFLLLCAAGAQEPEAVEAVTLQSSRLTAVIEDDLAYFTSMRFLDVSENALRLEQLLRLTGLEVLHLAYNRIDSLAGVRRAAREQQQMTSQDTNSAVLTRNSASVRSAAAFYAQKRSSQEAHAPQEVRPLSQSQSQSQNLGAQSGLEGSRCGSGNGNGNACNSPHWVCPRRTKLSSECSLHDVLLPNLHALNLSFNRVPSSDILHLSYFPFLEKLDLSGNELRTLPEDLAELTGVTHLALERNKLRNGSAVFAALSTMPALIEVNLNHNELRRVPPLSVRDGRGLCFPTIEVIGLSHNRMEEVRDVAALSELARTLQRVVLSGNPIAHKAKERAAVQECFAQAVLSLYWEQAGLRTGTAGTDGTGKGIGGEKMQEPFFRQSMESMGTLQEAAKSTRGEGEGQHTWGSLIASWRSHRAKNKQQSEHAGAKEASGSTAPHITSPMSQHGNELCYVVLSPNRQLSASNEIRDSELHETSGTPLNEDVSLEPLLDCSTAMNVFDRVFWYGDADEVPHVSISNDTPTPPATPPLFATGGTRSSPANETGLPPLPSPSLLRFVDVVFEEVVMQKQKPSYFYANRRQLIAEAEPHAGSRLASMWHPRTGLVTVPAYNEFMDIYRILKSSQRPQRAKAGARRTYKTRRSAKGVMMDIIPPSSPSHSDKEDEADTMEMEAANEPMPSTHVKGEEEYLEEEEEEEEEEKEGDDAPHESVSSRDVVFMTGVALEEGDPPKPRRTQKSRVPKGDSKQTHFKQEKTTESTAKAAKPQTETKSQPQQQRWQQQPKRQQSQMDPPPDTNVRILMNELRTMLRRPLPALPPLSTKAPRINGKNTTRTL